jgi:SAM-dependent methyltransferase
MDKLNLGCGLDYKEGWTNLDSNRNVKADIYLDINNGLNKIKSESFDYILADNILEHVDDFYSVMKELIRILKPNGKIEIYVPHYSSPNALKLPYHNVYFGIGSFDFGHYLGGMGRDYSMGSNILEEKLCLFQRKYHQSKAITFIAEIINKFNFIFNFSKVWKIFCERFWLFGFDEIKILLEKNEKSGKSKK